MNFLKTLSLIIGILTAFGAEAKNGIYIFPGSITPHTTLQNLKNTELVYFGGAVISRVKVISIYWSPEVDPLFTNNMANFYKDYVQSPQFTWLSEYGTNLLSQDGREGTHQQISAGTFLNEVTLTPQNQKQQLTDEEVQAELKYQINNSILPPPDEDMLYVIHFPSRIKITIDGMMSCRTFGGYHFNSEDPKLGSIRYAVLPDCSSSSASSEQRLKTMTFVASHEVMEAVTDPLPTPGDSPNYPQAWNTTKGEEVADLCYSGVMMHGAQRDFYVSKGWSNLRHSCY